MGIEIAALGWDHPDWQGSFYPPDLPEDWRLAYFATACDAVLVPLPLWQGTAPEVLAGWAAEVPPRFRFYLELPPDAGAAALSQADALGAALAGGVVIGPNPGNPDWPARDPQGAPILARPIPAGLLEDPPEALAWLRALTLDAGSRPALAVLVEGPAEDLAHYGQLVSLAGLG